MPKYKGDAYLRLSYSADRSVESDSIANQKKLIEDFVAAHPDIDLVSERVDDGYSGVLFVRPAFQEMMNDIVSGKINCVIVKDLSRLGREYIETGRYLRQVFPTYGVRFISINDGIDTANEQNGDDLRITLKNLLILTIIRQKAEVVMGEALRLKRCDGRIAAQKAQVDQEIAELGRQTQKDKALRAGLSSKSNTSVAQLGEAILTVGGTAKNLAGGTTELSAALGILADNGVKGAEGGTALRNIILSLSAPTDTAAKAMKDLGVEVFDAEGNMRPLNDTFSDFNAALSSVTQGKQTQVLSEIFNKVDLKSVNALLANTGERFDELTGYIDNAAGAAEKMANTQLDNLAGDITLFKSALEGAQIILSDQLAPDLREFVQFGSEGISKIASAFQEGGLSGAMEAFGTVLSDGLNMLIEQLPAMVDAGMQLLGALGQGIIDNMPTLIDSAIQIVATLAQGIVSALPELQATAAEMFGSFIGFLQENLPQMIASGLEALLSFSSGFRENVGVLVDNAIELIMTLADGIIEALPDLIETVPEIISNFANAINDNAPKLLKSAAELIAKLVKGLIENIPVIIKNIPKIISAIVDTITASGTDNPPS